MVAKSFLMFLGQQVHGRVVEATQGENLLNRKDLSFAESLETRTSKIPTMGCRVLKAELQVTSTADSVWQSNCTWVKTSIVIVSVSPFFLLVVL